MPEVTGTDGAILVTVVFGLVFTMICFGIAMWIDEHDA